MDGEPHEIEAKILELKESKGIDICLLKTGTKIMVETTRNVFELQLVNKVDNVLRIESTNKFFQTPMFGVLTKSIFDRCGKVFIPSWIGKGMRMCLRTQRGTLVSDPVKSACVYGVGQDGNEYKCEVWDD